MSPEARTLIAEVDEHFSLLYPAESNHLDPPEVLAAAHVHFFLARVDAQPAGCGAVKLFDEWGEIKRMYVRPAFRGRGIAMAILDALECCTREEGRSCLRLETGVRSVEALTLYRRLGFADTGPFPPYNAHPLSVFLEKKLG